jgi:2-C-methyl-D-erythritol 4-phosphate cytidylyltransferase/2-C-methyl-D-erythritol 2,4-cyclodiphosphate synthase
MPKIERTAAILVAAGRGLRAGSGDPKQYRSIGGQSVIYRAMEPFCRHPQIFAVQPVLNPDDMAMFSAAVSALRHAPPANGGPPGRPRCVPDWKRLPIKSRISF